MLPEWLAIRPASTIFVVCVSLLLAFLSTSINRLFTDKEKLKQVRAWKREIDAWTSDRIKAMRSGDQELLKKVKKKERHIKQLQAKMVSQSASQMKVLPITMVLFFVIWGFITGRFLYWPLFDTPFSVPVTVAYLPWFDGTLPLDFFSWYLICSMLFGFLFSRVFGLGMGATD
ncbi:MAG: DUF106 domain-containing protein [Candidatus Bathyarchaeota archaeon]|nr:MAG: DUF106 domain-containing protein [Candidatus Bathyarchaeota archaeon]